MATNSVFLTPLDVLLASKAAIGTLRVLARSDKQLPASTVAAAAGLSRASVYSVLNRGVALGLIGVAGSGQSRLFRLADGHQLSTPVLALFEAETRIARRLLDPIESWAGAVSPAPTAIWLSGPGRRQARPARLVNIALVGSGEAVHEQAEELRRRVEENLGADGPGTSIVSMTDDEASSLKRGNSRLWRELVRDAVPVVGPHPAELPT
jgi:sugar-specific transcriptional regulator TrmB